MTWQWMLFLYISGFAITGVVLAITSILATRYHRELPKKPILESIEVLEERKRQTEKDYDALRERLVAALHDIEEGQRWKDWMQENEARIGELKRDEQLLIETESQLANKREELIKQEEILRELKEREAALKITVADFDEKQKRIAELRKECDDLQVRRTQQAGELAHFEKEITWAKEDLSRTQEQLGDSRAELDKVREETERAQASLAEVKALHGKLTVECKQLETQAAYLRNHIAELTRDREAACPGFSAPSARMASVWVPVLHEGAFRGPSRETEVDALLSASDHFRKCGMKFHDRVIRAFHTSLKIASESPLVVLAGISGTGKSALPRLYAEGMGFHFLNVAVQPSWDSPMDMLGFFNHLEGRFRATELTRALVQMDAYGLRDGRWPERDDKTLVSLHDRMLIVLLDEMNLARVEYYFSEFLSKLEFRRDIDDSNAEQRRKAEIMLETGASGAKQQPMPIYPGTNVLFVGTMNEDESTQTLSDKVVDRANVLRFGMPADLKTAHRIRGLKGATEFVSYQTWREWYKTAPELDEPQEGKIQKFIADCNRALEPIGKPFAYRTANAIRAYVQQYPRAEEVSWLHHALADQLEQKVLPKFRGLDIQDQAGRDAIEKVRRIVDELDDRVLKKAIDRGADEAHEHQFVWRGVDRALDEGH